MTRRPIARGGTTRAAHVVAVVVVVLAARALAYALVLAGDLAGAAGGPALPAVIVVALALGLGVACAVLWLASLGVRERARLEPGTVAPRIGARGLALCAGGVFVAATAGFVALESVIHYRAGLGWHALECLTGPVHRDALPILAGLSVVAAAVLAAVRLVVAWMRRVLALLTARRTRARGFRLWVRGESAASRVAQRAGARGPPLVVR